MKYIVIDLEMNPLPVKYKRERRVCKNETLQLGAVCLDENYREIDSFMTYVRPRINPTITRTISDLTGITTTMIQGAPKFEIAVRDYFRWCDSFADTIKFLQWSDSDYRQLSNEMELSGFELSPSERIYMEAEWGDLQEEFGKTIGKGRKTSLSDALMLMGTDFHGRQHDALYDARNEADILRVLKDPLTCKKMLGVAMEALQETRFAFTIADAVNLSMFEIPA